MGNCLVTKLKENVNNNNLLHLGEIVLKVREFTESTFLLRSTLYGGATYKVVTDNGYVRETSSDSDIPVNGSSEITVRAYPIYDNTNFITDYCQVVESDLTILKYLHITGSLELKGYPDKNVQNINIPSLEEFNFVDFLRFRVPNCYSLKGDIVEFGNSLSINMIDVVTSSVTGSIESLVERSVTNGRTSGTISLNMKYTKVTLNGSSNIPHTNNLTVNFNGNNVTVVNSANSTLYATYTPGAAEPWVYENN